MEADNHSNGIDCFPCHPIHSKRPYNTALSVYRHAAGENEKSAAAATLLLSTDSLGKQTSTKILGFVDRASRYTRVKENQLDAHLITSIFHQPLHVSGVSRPIIRRYNRMYTTVGTYYSFWMSVCCPGWIQPGQHTVIQKK
jgi:hypothetical protein